MIIIIPTEARSASAAVRECQFESQGDATATVSTASIKAEEQVTVPGDRKVGQPELACSAGSHLAV